MNGHSAKPEATKDRGDKRERILGAAMRVFAMKGFFGAKVADIALEAGVADGTIYLYFKSKDDILISLFEHQMERVDDVMRTAMAAGQTASDKLRRFVAAYVDLVQKNPHATEVITIELRQSAKFLKEYQNPHFAAFLKLIAQVIDEGQKSGELRSVMPPSLAARLLFGALDELALAWVSTKGERVDIARTGEQLADLILGGLAARHP
jgi:TetR/AcrR family fatty acid metabolism transcriptional regulator